jgi:hypothetical protein
MTSGSTVPASAPVLLVGDPPAQAPGQHVLRRAIRFPEPPDGVMTDEIRGDFAIAQLEGLRRSGAAYLILPATASGWFAARPDLRSHVEGRYRLLVDDDGCRVFDLRRSPITAFLDSILSPGEPVIAVLGGHAELDLSGRPVHRLDADSLGRIEGLRLQGLQFLVLADMSPWRPADTAIVQVRERRFRRIASRPGLCEVFDLTTEAAARRDKRSSRLLTRVFGDG